jgi:hypothetical protein
MSDCSWNAFGDYECRGAPVAPFGSSLQRDLAVAHQGSHAPQVVLRQPVHQGSHMSIHQGSHMPARQPLPMAVNRPSQMPTRQAGGQAPQGPTYRQAPPVQWSQRQFKPGYYFSTAYQKYHDLVGSLGQPDALDPQPGGLAVWTGRQLAHTPYRSIYRLVVVDEQILQDYPQPHVGFLYTYVKLDIPQDKVENITTWLTDTSYDRNAKLLCVRGVSLNYNIALFALICLYVKDRLRWHRIIERNLVAKITDLSAVTNPRNQDENLRIITKIISSQKEN